MTKTFHSSNASSANIRNKQDLHPENVFDPDRFRLAAFDLDGTLLCGREPVHVPVKQALHALEQSGVTVVASSGRNGTQFKRELSSLFHYAVLSNGALTTDTRTGKTLFSHPIDRLIALYAIDRIQGMGGTCFVQQGAHMISPVQPLPAILRECRKYRPSKRLSSAIKLIRIYYGQSAVCSDTLKKAQKDQRPFYKLQAFFPDASAAKAAAGPLHAETELNVLAIGDGTLELTAPGVSKANALQELAASLGMSEGNIAAFGDSMNDLEMLSRAGFSVAMQNGDPHLFDSVDRIAPSVVLDGAAEMIRSLWKL